MGGALIGPSTSRDLPEVIKEEPMDFDDPDWTTEEPEKKRGRGRPRIPRPYPEPPKRPRGRPPTAATVAVINEYDSSTMSEGDQKLVKYRRMRDLNNAASKRCRVNRKRKFEVMKHVWKRPRKSFSPWCKRRISKIMTSRVPQQPPEMRSRLPTWFPNSILMLL